MKLEQSFRVAAPADEVWRALVDVQRVAPCLPGANVTEAQDGTYRGVFTVKLGPTTVAYSGTLRMEHVDEAAHEAVMAARGTDRRGQGGATATISSRVRKEGEETSVVDVVTDVTITGRLARFGRGGMIEDVSRRLLRDFAECLQANLTAAPPAAAAPAPEVPASLEAAAAASAPPPPASRPLDAAKLGREALLDRIRAWWKRFGQRLRGRGGGA